MFAHYARDAMMISFVTFDSAKTLELLKKKRFANALGAHKELGMVSKVAKPSSHIVLRLLDGSPN